MCKNKVRYTIDNDSEQLLLKDKDEETDLIEQAELIFSMARFIMNDEKIKEKPLYHFSSESYLCSNGNIEIYYEGKIYIMPNLKHVELIEYQFIDFLGRYKEKILKNEY